MQGCATLTGWLESAGRAVSGSVYSLCEHASKSSGAHRFMSFGGVCDLTFHAPHPSLTPPPKSDVFGFRSSQSSSAELSGGFPNRHCVDCLFWWFLVTGKKVGMFWCLVRSNTLPYYTVSPWAFLTVARHQGTQRIPSPSLQAPVNPRPLEAVPEAPTGQIE